MKSISLYWRLLVVSCSLAGFYIGALLQPGISGTAFASQPATVAAPSAAEERQSVLAVVRMTADLLLTDDEEYALYLPLARR